MKASLGVNQLRGAAMKLAAFALTCGALLTPGQAIAFGPGGHQAVGAIADELLKGTRAGDEVRQILGTTLRTASVWADCVKGVDEEEFEYGARGKRRECAPYENDDSIALMEDFVRRNVGTCPMPANAESCHRQYHYTDVAIQRDRYALGLRGTSDHDIVAAINAMISVLQGKPAPAPFDIADKKEALRLLSHYVGDIHQPLHVGAVYLDGAGHLNDPDQGNFDPQTDTRGGNDLLLDHPAFNVKPRKLHSLWDTVTGSVVKMPVPASVRQQALAVAQTTGAVESWAVQWATESLVASKDAFNGLTYESLDHKAKLYFLALPDGYKRAAAEVVRKRAVEAGARLAQLLKVIWP